MHHCRYRNDAGYRSVGLSYGFLACLSKRVCAHWPVPSLNANWIFPCDWRCAGMCTNSYLVCLHENKPWACSTVQQTWGNVSVCLLLELSCTVLLHVCIKQRHSSHDALFLTSMLLRSHLWSWNYSWLLRILMWNTATPQTADTDNWQRLNNKVILCLKSQDFSLACWVIGTFSLISHLLLSHLSCFFSFPSSFAMSKTAVKKLHWRSKVQDSFVPLLGSSGELGIAIGGGADYGEFPFVTSAPGGGLTVGDIILEIGGTPVLGMTLGDVRGVLNSCPHPIRIKTVSPGMSQHKKNTPLSTSLQLIVSVDVL